VEHLSSTTSWVSSRPYHKHETRLESPTRDNPTSLLGAFFYYYDKKFYNILPWLLLPMTRVILSQSLRANASVHVTSTDSALPSPSMLPRLSQGPMI